MGATAIASTVEERALADLLRDGLFVDGDWIETKDQDPNGEVRLIQLADIGDGVFRDRSSRFLTMDKAHELGCTFLEPNDILVARMPEPLGRACIFPGVGHPAVTAVDVCIIRPNRQRLSTEWLLSAINSPSFRDSMREFVRGTTRQRISRKNLGIIRLRVPPMAEQVFTAHRVSGIEAKRVSSAERLDKAGEMMKAVRRAILMAATTGRLTAAWRDKHQEAAPSRDESRARGGRLRPMADFDLAEIPVEWTWMQVDDLLPPGGIFDGPFGSNLKTSDYTTAGARVIRLENVGHLRLIDSKKTYVSLSKFAELTKHSVHSGDVIFASFVEDPVRVCVLPDDLEGPSIAKADCFTLRPHPEIDPQYLSLQLASPQSYSYLAADVHGATRPRVNTTQLRSLPIAICSHSEQIEIVKRFKALSAVADRVDRRIGQVQLRLARLMSSIRTLAEEDLQSIDAGSGS